MSSTQTWLLAFLRYDSPTGVAIVLLLGAIVMTANIVFILRRMQLVRDRFYDQFAAYLARRGWTPSLKVPDNAIASLCGSRIYLYLDSSTFSCAHAIHANSATSYLAVAKWGGGRGESANTVLLATADLRAPVECLIATDSQTKEASQPGLRLICLRPRGNQGRDLFVYFKSKHPVDEQQLARTYRIIGLIFDNAENVLDPASVALLGPKGLVIRGPTLDFDRKIEPMVESLVAAAPHLLDHCEAVWKENHS